MADEPLLNAAARIADGEIIDWGSITSRLPSEEERATAEELALVARIAAGHRQLHQLLPDIPDTPHSLMPDRARWAHLDLLNVVGRGSYGTVYRAWDTRLERLVALKLFHGAPNPEVVMQEGRMLARMRHENVVTIYGADVSDGVAGIWMELVHGRTLDSLIKTEGPMAAREAAAVGLDVARALGAVHAAGIIHCDVKAQNVVRESTGRVVLMDLGAGRVAADYHDSDTVSDVAGTPRYMAPELFKSGSKATKLTDIYSFGVLMYYLLSGKYPVEGRTLGELRKAHEAGTGRALAEAMRGLPAPLVDAVTRAIAYHPEDRPQSISDLQAMLAPIAAAPPVRKTKRLSRWWAAAAAVAAVIVVAAALWRGSALFAPPPPENTLAVMPIRNLTGDPSKQYLADGLTEMLIAQLARVPGLDVVSSATMATLRGSTETNRALADRLGVRLLLAGSVVQADNRIRINITLDDPRAGRALWGTELERTPETIMTARSEVSRLVAARLSLDAPREALTVQHNREAQDAFLRGLVEESSVGANARMLEAERHFERAVQLEPQWAEPLAHLAYVQQYTTEFGNPARRRERADVVRANATRAIELDPAVAMSYVALAAVQAYHDWDLRGAEGTLRQALTAQPRDGVSRSRLSLVLAATGRTDDAVREAERARDDEPLVPDRHATLGIVRYYAGDFSGALAEYDRAIALSPAFGVAHIGKARAFSALGRYNEAVASAEKALDISANAGWIAFLGMIHAQAGLDADVAAVLKQLRALEENGTFVSSDNYGYIAAYQGRLDEAFGLVQQAIDRRMTNVLWLPVDPRADALRQDPRFDQLVTRMKISR